MMSPGDEFGLERLVEMLRLNVKSTAEGIQSRLQDAVISFSADAPQHDDITMMVLGFREAGD